MKQDLVRLFLIRDKSSGKVIEAIQVTSITDVWREYEEVERRITEENEDNIEAGFVDADYIYLRQLALTGALK